jgi:hypothetical protein
MKGTSVSSQLAFVRFLAVALLGTFPSRRSFASSVVALLFLVGADRDPPICSELCLSLPPRLRWFS